MSIKQRWLLFGELIGLNKKIIAVSILFLMALAAVITPLEVYGQNTNLGVGILQITPSSATAPVGTSVNVQGTIYTSNGTYQIIFDKAVVVENVSEGYYVNVNFTVPELPSGGYALILRDVDINVNSSSQTFTITTGYSIIPVPSSIQEGNSLTLDVSVTGGQSNTAYSIQRYCCASKSAWNCILKNGFVRNR